MQVVRAFLARIRFRPRTSHNGKKIDFFNPGDSVFEFALLTRNIHKKWPRILITPWHPDRLSLNDESCGRGNDSQAVVIGAPVKKKNRKHRKHRQSARHEARDVHAKRREGAKKEEAGRASATWLRMAPSDIEEDPRP